MKALEPPPRPAEILLVEDSPGEIRLTREAFRETRVSVNLHVASDGEGAMRFLRHEGDCANAPRPDLILLDLDLPTMDGRDVLAQIKQDAGLKAIPTVVLTASMAEADLLKSYELQANCYLSKPVLFDEFEALVKSIDELWLPRSNWPRRSAFAP